MCAAGMEPFESKAKVVISVWGIIMENPQEPSFSEAQLNLPPLSVRLSVSILHFSAPVCPLSFGFRHHERFEKAVCELVCVVSRAWV